MFSRLSWIQKRKNTFVNKKIRTDIIHLSLQIIACLYKWCWISVLLAWQVFRYPDCWEHHNVQNHNAYFGQMNNQTSGLEELIQIKSHVQHVIAAPDVVYFQWCNIMVSYCNISETFTHINLKIVHICNNLLYINNIKYMTIQVHKISMLKGNTVYSSFFSSWSVLSRLTYNAL